MQLLFLAALAAVGVPLQTPVSDSAIRVTPAQVISHVSPWMYGSCIEDVNHEIYGGLYAQRIFGESFEEPPASPIGGWTGYDGDWRIENGVLTVGASAGAKLVRSLPVVGDGGVACDIRFADAHGDNAGLILRVSDPHIGADSWTGYEISLSAKNRTLILGRHRSNWEPLRTVSAPVEVGHWHRLRVDMSGSTLRIYLDGGAAPLLEFTDGSETLRTGLVGLRTWNSNASFRNLTIASAADTVFEPLDGSEPQSGSAVSGMWDPISTGSAKARYVWDSENPFNTAHSQRITFVEGAGTAGVSNRGLNRWGVAVKPGVRMTGRLYLRQMSYTGRVTVALQSADGSRTYAQQNLAPVGTDWTRRDFSLAPNAANPNARLAVWIDRPGTVWVDQVYLSETGKALFRGLPMRSDIGEKLVAEGLTFLRYGGTMVNAAEYRWKKMIGDRDKRPQYHGYWYPQSTNGFGIEEFLRFCESARIEPAFAIDIEETPEDAADLVEYLTGSETSTWGAKRAANGHPKPYRLHTIEIGNEEAIGGNRAEYAHYLERFKLLYAAMRPQNPDMNYVIAAWWRPDEPLCKQIAQELNGKAALWDVHVGGDGLRDAEEVDRTLTRMQQLFGEWIPGSSLKACIFEENGGRHDLQRALGHARILNVTQRHGDFVRMDCPANCLQPFGQNDNGWDQGQVFFLPDRVWAMPPYYAQQMAAADHLPLCVACDVDSPNNDLDATATRGEDGKTLVIQVVNSSDKPHTAGFRLDGWTPAARPADLWTLSGDLTAFNTPEAPERVRWTRRTANVSGATFEFAFAPYSYTILRLRRK